MATNTQSNTKPARLPWPILLVSFAACLVPVFMAGGFRSGLTYWNALPIFLGFFALAAFGLRPAATWFALVAVGLAELFHLAWLGDWGGTATVHLL